MYRFPRKNPSKEVKEDTRSQNILMKRQDPSDPPAGSDFSDSQGVESFMPAFVKRLIRREILILSRREVGEEVVGESGCNGIGSSDDSDRRSNAKFDNSEYDISAKAVDGNDQMDSSKISGSPKMNPHQYSSFFRHKKVALRGIVMVVDISGFTKLASKMTIEMLRKTVNDCFSIIISNINDFSGDVIRFCGDSLIVLWTSENLNVKDGSCNEEEEGANSKAISCDSSGCNSSSPYSCDSFIMHRMAMQACACAMQLVDSIKTSNCKIFSSDASNNNSANNTASSQNNTTTTVYNTVGSVISVDAIDKASLAVPHAALPVQRQELCQEDIQNSDAPAKIANSIPLIGDLTVHIGIVSGSFNFLILSSEKQMPENTSGSVGGVKGGGGRSSNRDRSREWLLTGTPLTILSDLLNITTAFEVGICRETKAHLRGKLELIPHYPAKFDGELNYITKKSNEFKSSALATDVSDKKTAFSVEIASSIEDSDAQEEVNIYYKLTGRLAKFTASTWPFLPDYLRSPHVGAGIDEPNSATLPGDLIAATARTDISINNLPLVSASNISIETNTFTREDKPTSMQHRRLSTVLIQKISSLLHSSIVDEKSNEMSACQASSDSNNSTSSSIEASIITSSSSSNDKGSITTGLPLPFPTPPTPTPPPSIISLLSSNIPSELEVLAKTSMTLVEDIDSMIVSHPQASCFKCDNYLLTEPHQHFLYEEMVSSFIHSSASLSSIAKSSDSSLKESSYSTFNTSLLFLAEMRSVSTVFLLVKGLDSIVHSGNIGVLQSLYEILHSSFSLYRGILRQLVVDDKGLVAVACFGLKTRDIDIRCLQALHSCIEISRRVDVFLSTPIGLPHKDTMEIQFGISDGVCYIGNIGAFSRYEFINMGNEVNIAARFMSKQIVVPKGDLKQLSNKHDIANLDYYEKLNLKYTIHLDEFVYQCCSCLHEESFHKLGKMTFKGIMRVVVGYKFVFCAKGNKSIPQESSFSSRLEQTLDSALDKTGSPIELHSKVGNMAMLRGLPCQVDLVDDIGLTQIISTDISRRSETKDNKFLAFLNSSCLLERISFHSIVGILAGIYNRLDACNSSCAESMNSPHYRHSNNNSNSSNLLSISSQDLDISKMCAILKSISNQQQHIFTKHSKQTSSSSLSSTAALNSDSTGNIKLQSTPLFHSIAISKISVISPSSFGSPQHHNQHYKQQRQRDGGLRDNSDDDIFKLDQVHIVYLSLDDCTRMDSSSSSCSSSSISNKGGNRFSDCKSSLFALRKLFANFFNCSMYGPGSSSAGVSSFGLPDFDIRQQATTDGSLESPYNTTTAAVLVGGKTSPPPLPALISRKSGLGFGLGLGLGLGGGSSSIIYPDLSDDTSIDRSNPSPNSNPTPTPIKRHSILAALSLKPLSTTTTSSSSKGPLGKADGGLAANPNPFYSFITDNLPNVSMLVFAKKVENAISALSKRRATCSGSTTLKGIRVEADRFADLAGNISQFIEDLDAAAQMSIQLASSSGTSLVAATSKSILYYAQLYVDDLVDKGSLNSSYMTPYTSVGGNQSFCLLKGGVAQAQTPTAMILIIIAIYASVYKHGLDVGSLGFTSDKKNTTTIGGGRSTGSSSSFANNNNISNVAGSCAGTSIKSQNPLNPASTYHDSSQNGAYNSSEREVNWLAPGQTKCNVLILLESIFQSDGELSKVGTNANCREQVLWMDQSYLLLELADLLKDDLMFKSGRNINGASCKVTTKDGLKASSPSSLMMSSSSNSSRQSSKGVVVVQTPGSVLTSIMFHSSSSSPSSSSSNLQIKPLTSSTTTADPNEKIECINELAPSLLRVEDTISRYIEMEYFEKFASIINYSGYQIVPLVLEDNEKIKGRMEDSQLLPNISGRVNTRVEDQTAISIFKSISSNVYNQLLALHGEANDIMVKFSSMANATTACVATDFDIAFRNDVYLRIAVLILLDNFKKLRFGNMNVELQCDVISALDRYDGVYYDLGASSQDPPSSLSLPSPGGYITGAQLSPISSSSSSSFSSSFSPSSVSSSQLLGAFMPYIKPSMSLLSKAQPHPNLKDSNPGNAGNKNLHIDITLSSVYNLVAEHMHESKYKDCGSPREEHINSNSNSNSNSNKDCSKSLSRTNSPPANDSMLALNSSIQQKNINSLHKSGTSSLFRNVDLLDEAILKVAALIDSRCDITSRIWKTNYLANCGNAPAGFEFEGFGNSSASFSNSSGGKGNRGGEEKSGHGESISSTGEFTIGELDLLVTMYGIGSGSRAGSSSDDDNADSKESSSSASNSKERSSSPLKGDPDYTTYDFIHFHALQALTGAQNNVANCYDGLLVSRLSKLVERGILVECSAKQQSTEHSNEDGSGEGENQSPTGNVQKATNAATAANNSCNTHRLRSGIYRFSDAAIQMLFYNMNLKSQRAQTHHYLSKYYACIYAYMVMKLNQVQGYSDINGKDKRLFRNDSRETNQIEDDSDFKLANIQMYYSRDLIIAQLQYHNIYGLDVRKRIHARNDLAERAVGNKMFTTALLLLSDILQDAFAFREFNIAHKLLSSYHAERMYSDLPSYHKGCSKSLTSFAKKLKRANLRNGQVYKSTRFPPSKSGSSGSRERGNFDEKMMHEDSILTIACLSCTCRCILSSKAKINFNSRGSVASSDGGSTSNNDIISNRSNSSNSRFSNNNSSSTTSPNSHSFRQGGTSRSFNDSSSRHPLGSRSKESGGLEDNKLLTEEESSSLAILVLMKMSSLLARLKCHKLATIFDTVVMHMYGVTTSEKVVLPDLATPRSLSASSNMDNSSNIDPFISHREEDSSRNIGGSSRVNTNATYSSSYSSGFTGTTSYPLKRVSKFQKVINKSSSIPKHTSLFIYTFKKALSNRLISPVTSLLSSCLDACSIFARNDYEKKSIELQTFSINFLLNYLSSSKFNSKVSAYSAADSMSDMKESQKRTSLLGKAISSCLGGSHSRSAKVYMYANIDDEDISGASVRLKSQRRGSIKSESSGTFIDLDPDLCSYVAVFHLNILSSCISFRSKNSGYREGIRTDLEGYLIGISTPTMASSSKSIYTPSRSSAERPYNNLASLHLMTTFDSLLSKDLEMHRYDYKGDKSSSLETTEENAFHKNNNNNISNNNNNNDDSEFSYRDIDPMMNIYLGIIEKLALKSIFFQGYTHIHKNLRSRKVKNNGVFTHGNLDFISELISVHVLEFDSIFFDFLKPILKAEFGNTCERFQTTRSRDRRSSSSGGGSEVDNHRGDNYHTDIYFDYFVHKWDNELLGRVFRRCPVGLIRLLAIFTAVARLKLPFDINNNSSTRVSRSKNSGLHDKVNSTNSRDSGRSAEAFVRLYCNHIIESLIHHIYYSDYNQSIDPGAIALVQICHAVSLFADAKYYPAIKYVFSSIKKLDFMQADESLGVSLKTFISILICIFGGVCGNFCSHRSRSRSRSGQGRGQERGQKEKIANMNNIGTPLSNYENDGAVDYSPNGQLISFIRANCAHERRLNTNCCDNDSNDRQNDTDSPSSFFSTTTDEISLLDLISCINCSINSQSSSSLGVHSSVFSVEELHQARVSSLVDFLGLDSIFYLVSKKFIWAYTAAHDVIMEGLDIHDWSYFDTFLPSKNKDQQQHSTKSNHPLSHRVSWTRTVWSIFRSLIAAVTVIRVADAYFGDSSNASQLDSDQHHKHNSNSNSNSKAAPGDLAASTSTESSTSDNWWVGIDANALSSLLREVFTLLQTVSPIIDDKFTFLKPLKSLLFIMWDILSWKIIVESDNSSDTSASADSKGAFSSEILFTLLRNTSIPEGNLKQSCGKNLKYISILWEGHLKLILETSKRDKAMILAAVLEGMEIDIANISQLSNSLNILQYFVEIYLWEIKKMNFYLQHGNGDDK